jgi:pimeloyl-ACP methyl ester carboxylesterase
VNRITANGIDFAYLSDGPPDGPLVLCLHGFPDHAPSFELLLGDLGAAGFHAVAPWLRGYAPSGAPADGTYGTAALAEDALALTDALAAGAEACLVGHDWGAGATYTAAQRKPERFRKIVTLAVPHGAGMARFITSPAQLQRSFYIFLFQLPVAEIAVSANDFAFIDYLWSYWSPGFTPEPGFMRALKDTLSQSLEAAIGNYRAMFSGGGFGDSSIAVPTLYMHGRDDGCLGLDAVDLDAMRSAFSAGLKVEIVDGAGHFLHLERPDVVNKRIVEFLMA